MGSTPGAQTQHFVAEKFHGFQFHIFFFTPFLVDSKAPTYHWFLGPHLLCVLGFFGPIPHPHPKNTSTRNQQENWSWQDLQRHACKIKDHVGFPGPGDFRIGKGEEKMYLDWNPKSECPFFFGKTLIVIYYPHSHSLSSSNIVVSNIVFLVETFFGGFFLGGGRFFLERIGFGDF